MANDEQALADAMTALRERRASLARLRADLGSVSGTATAPRQVVSVTVGPRGRLTDLRFPTGAYRAMAPAELAEVITKTVADAHAQAMARWADLLAPMLPAGLSAEAVLAGTADLNDLVSDEPHTAGFTRTEEKR
jgi:YbaB/EbfC DNA-binding family protein